MTEYLDHIKKNYDHFQEMPHEKLCLFLACACERQRSVYNRAIKDMSDNRTLKFNKILDDIWESLNPAHHEKTILSFNYESLLPKVEEGDNDYATQPVISVYSLSKFIKDKTECQKILGKPCSFVILENAVDILDALIYSNMKASPDSNNDTIVAQHPLMKLELLSMQIDYNEILFCNMDEKLFKRARTRSQCEPLERDLWF